MSTIRASALWPVSAVAACGMDADRVVHAVKMFSRPATGSQTTAAICGADVLLYGDPVKDHPDLAAIVAWPPRVKELEPPSVRCRGCYEATGKPRPARTKAGE